jgi:hypothetical protein
MKWRRAIDTPRSWEGKLAWQWNNWEPWDRAPHQTVIPVGFDRSTRACDGTYFMLLKCPKPPVLL